MVREDFGDSDDDQRYGGGRGGGGGMRSSYSSSKSSSILKNSRGNSKFSDDDDTQMYGSNSGSSRYNRGGADRRNNESPLDSHRSNSLSKGGGGVGGGGKPPSGRLPGLGGGGSGSGSRFDQMSTSKYDQPIGGGSGSSNSRSRGGTVDPPLAITYPNSSPYSSKLKEINNDSDESITDRYNRFKKTGGLSSTNNNDKYDTYDEDDSRMKNGGGSSSSRFYRSESPLKHATVSSLSPNEKSSALEKLNLRGLGGSTSQSSKNARSNSLDRLNGEGGKGGAGGLSSLSSQYGRSSGLKQYSSVNNIDQDNGYNNSSINSAATNLSIREAKSRSFLVGSLSALNGKGLLSHEEIDRHLSERKARVLISTWNMGGVKKCGGIEELILPDIIQTMPDVYVLGVQEFELNQKEWEICLQEHIGPTHVKISSFYTGSVGAVVFVKRELIWFCSLVEYESVNLRSVNAPGKTKASIAVSFQLFGTLFCFVCSHFAAGQGNVEQRIDNYQSTIKGIKLPKKLSNKMPATSQDMTENFDAVFWFGDLNFLINKERDKILPKVSRMRSSYTSSNNNYEDIINHDELSIVIAQDKAFKSFLEGRITFEPTYKYDLNTDNFDTSEKNRIPSYCDRILYRSRVKGTISCSYYDSIKEVKLSDHRPVFGLYEVTIRPGVDKVPLSYGDFDRAVYAAGYQKRQMYRAYNIGFKNVIAVKESKKPCVIM